LLRTVADADREDEEGNEDRERVELEAECGDDAELPDDGDERAGEDERCRANAARVEPDDRRGDRGREAEVEPDLEQAVDEIADQLGEADHLEPGGAVGLDAGADLLD